MIICLFTMQFFAFTRMLIKKVDNPGFYRMFTKWLANIRWCKCKLNILGIGLYGNFV